MMARVRAVVLCVGLLAFAGELVVSAAALFLVLF
jgi:hypothetical protein